MTRALVSSMAVSSASVSTSSAAARLSRKCCSFCVPTMVEDTPACARLAAMATCESVTPWSAATSRSSVSSGVYFCSASGWNSGFAVRKSVTTLPPKWNAPERMPFAMEL